jgi:hypothetical protein
LFRIINVTDFTMSIETSGMRQRSAGTAKTNTVKEDSKNRTDSTKKITDDDGTNYVEGGIEQNAFFFGLIVAAPFLSLLLAYLTSEEMASPPIPSR